MLMPLGLLPSTISGVAPQVACAFSDGPTSWRVRDDLLSRPEVGPCKLLADSNCLIGNSRTSLAGPVAMATSAYNGVGHARRGKVTIDPVTEAIGEFVHDCR